MGAEIGIPYLGELSYLAIPLVFLLGSFGFPMMEELVLLAAGYAAFAGVFSLPIAVLVAFFSAILVDNLGFYLGSHGHWLVRRFINGRTLERVTRAVNSHGPAAVFLARFIPGMRALTPWVASTSGMHWRRFALANALGALIQTPAIIVIGYLLGPHFERGIALAQSFHRVAPLLLLIMFVLAAILVCVHRKSVRTVFLGGANGRI